MSHNTNTGSLVSEAIQQTRGVTVDHTKWTNTSIGNGKYVMLERTDNTEPRQSGGALAMNLQTVSLAFESKSNKTMCEMCSMYFDKSSMEYRVPRHRIIDYQKLWNYHGIQGRRYESASFLYSMVKVCTFCAQFFEDDRDLKELSQMDSVSSPATHSRGSSMSPDKYSRSSPDSSSHSNHLSRSSSQLSIIPYSPLSSPSKHGSPHSSFLPPKGSPLALAPLQSPLHTHSGKISPSPSPGPSPGSSLSKHHGHLSPSPSFSSPPGRLMAGHKSPSGHGHSPAQPPHHSPLNILTMFQPSSDTFKVKGITPIERTDLALARRAYQVAYPPPPPPP